ncbi:MAG: DNA translocase FtsK, partial [Spirochaetaceae bacterium]|nr:DNA translocase FtsK [Spirochaetaceae bacterium]
MKAISLFFAKNTLIRNASVIAAFVLLLLAALTVIFIFYALALPGAAKGPGDLLLNAYGLFSLLIPAWFIWGGAILLSPVFSFRSVFALDASTVPFFTLATGFHYTRNFARFAENSAMLSALGLQGVSLTIVVIALMETVAIGALAYKLFPVAAVRRKSRRAQPARKPSGTDTKKHIHTDDYFVMRNQPAKPFTVIKTPLQGEIPLPLSIMKEPELPNPVDDVVLEAGPVADNFTVLAEPEKNNDSFADLIISAPDYFQLPDCLKEEEADPDDDADIRNALESLSPALDGLDMVLNDLFAGIPAETPEHFDDSAPVSGDDAALEPEAGLPLEPECGFTLESDEPAIAAVPDELAAVDEIEESDGIEELADTDCFSKPLAIDEYGESSEPATVEECGESGELSAQASQPLAPEEYEPAAPCSDEPVAVKRNIPVLPSAHNIRAGSYGIPIDGILKEYPDGQYWIIDEATRDAARILKETLFEFNIEADVVGIRKGPVITMFEVLPAPGVKLSRIVNLQDNIAMRLAAASVRIVAPIPGKHAVGIEIPNAKRNIVSFHELIEGEMKAGAGTGVIARAKKPEIPVILGKDITGEAVTIDLATTPHLLIAGSTGSGKSVCVNTMILSILYRCHPAECRLLLVDPKIVELNLYNDIPHLLAPVITEPKRALQALQYCISEMERRYSCLDSMHVRDIKSYNNRIKEQRIATEHMPYIVVVIDEFADLMATTGKELETTVARLAAKSRAVGIHLVLATQRPSTDVITGLIKSNVPSRIAFMVASQIDSRIIIDTTGAEKLLGKGDMLYSGIIDPFPVRMQGAFVSEEEVERVVDYVKTLGEPDYIDDEIFFDEEDDRDTEFLDGAEDPLFERATEIVYQQGRASASYIQRRLKIGYNRAARLVEL